MYQELYEQSKEVICGCRDLFLEHQEIQISCKEGIQDLLTTMDTEVEEYLIHQLNALCPKATILSEEGEKNISDCMWIIDPIDGTTNFITQGEDFAISVAFYVNKQPIFGMVYDVMKDRLYHAYQGKGSYCNYEALSINNTCRLSCCVWDASYHSILQLAAKGYQMIELAQKTRGHRSMGCASLAIVKIALQKNNAYLSSHVKCWDYAAAWLILKECGGAMWMTQNFFTTENNIALFTGNETLLEEMRTYVCEKQYI